MDLEIELLIKGISLSVFSWHKKKERKEGSGATCSKSQEIQSHFSSFKRPSLVICEEVNDL